MARLEREDEAHFLDFCTGLGIRCEKLKMASKGSWPDRTLLYRGHVRFHELKRRGESPTPLQLYTIDQLKSQGFEVGWSNDLEQAKFIVIAWKHYVDDLLDSRSSMDSLRTSNSTNR